MLSYRFEIFCDELLNIREDDCPICFLKTEYGYTFAKLCFINFGESLFSLSGILYLDLNQRKIIRKDISYEESRKYSFVLKDKTIDVMIDDNYFVLCEKLFDMFKENEINPELLDEYKERIYKKMPNELQNIFENIFKDFTMLF